MTRRALVEFDSEHPDFPRWGSPEFAPVQGPCRLTLMLHEHRRAKPSEHAPMVQLELFA